MTHETWLTVAQVSRWLGLSERQVRNLCRPNGDQPVKLPNALQRSGGYQSPWDIPLSDVRRLRSIGPRDPSILAELDLPTSGTSGASGTAEPPPDDDDSGNVGP